MATNASLVELLPVFALDASMGPEAADSTFTVLLLIRLINSPLPSAFWGVIIPEPVLKLASLFPVLDSNEELLTVTALFSLVTFVSLLTVVSVVLVESAPVVVLVALGSPSGTSGRLRIC